MSARDQVLSAAAKIVADFGSHETKSYFSNFAQDATFIFHSHPVRLESRAAYEQLWNSWESQDGFRVHSCNSTNALVQLFGVDTAVFTHDVETTAEFAGEKSTVFEKETIVFSRENDSWIAVHEHLSPASGS